ncbi:cytochrome P450, family 718 [Tasmannia lanceolata]|uniref:cytochrome P450, family 718 n=1 Tax=Tasmannia lanceolata TaxID=3420 RepID=UPI0040641E57
MVLSLLLVCISFSMLLLIQKKMNKKKNLPPGEMGFPWIGEMMQFYRAQLANRLYEDFVQPRIIKHGNIFKTRLMGEPTVVVSGSTANRFFLSNEFKLVVSSWPSASVQLMGKDCIMAKDGDRHRWLRSAFASCLTGPALENLIPKLCGAVEAHLDLHWGEKETVFLFNSVKVLMFSVVLECLFGIEAEQSLLDLFEKVLSGVFALPLDLPGCRFWKAKRARVKIGKALVCMVRERKEEIERRGRGRRGGEEGGLLLSLLVGGLIEGEISEEEVVDNVVLLVFAAHDTTAFAIAMMCRMLGCHPDCYARLLQEHLEISGSKRRGEKLTWEDIQKMEYTWQVSRESMRLFPPIFGSFRRAVVDIDYQGFIIPKGWKVLWTTYGTHYNPQYFQEPLTFDPSRFEDPVTPYAFIPFGGGPRLCVGYQLAKLNILIFIHFMVTRYEWSLIDPQEPIIMDPLPIPSHGMPIKITQKIL